MRRGQAYGQAERGAQTAAPAGGSTSVEVSIHTLHQRGDGYAPPVESKLWSVVKRTRRSYAEDRAVAISAAIAGQAGAAPGTHKTRSFEYLPSGYGGIAAYSIEFADSAYRSFRLDSASGF